jgi:hypothetical protein
MRWIGVAIIGVGLILSGGVQAKTTYFRCDKNFVLHKVLKNLKMHWSIYGLHKYLILAINTDTERVSVYSEKWSPEWTPWLKYKLQDPGFLIEWEEKSGNMGLRLDTGRLRVWEKAVLGTMPILHNETLLECKNQPALKLD